MGAVQGGGPGLREVSRVHAEGTDGVDRAHACGAEGPGHHSDRRRLSSINVALRKKFELYCNFRPIQNLPHIPTRYPDVDLIIIRENTEGLYSGIEHEVVPGVVESLKIITEKASTRIARLAFEYARKYKRKQIHAIHKANIMKLSDGLFLRCSRNVAKEYPEITYGEHIVDNTCMQLVIESLPVRHAADGKPLRRYLSATCARPLWEDWDWCRAPISATGGHV